ncbi:hypothetical protein BDY24DRAFT_375592 [Mrakia frigida]|uniref:zinc finger MYND domain-containing protein n=1 Tax=Mrakia frigida TaxID=29902 RepID=UPI003FCC051C
MAFGDQDPIDPLGFGKLLGLAPGLGGKPASFVGLDASEQAVFLVKRTQAALSTQKWHEFVEEFFAIYLPSFARTMIAREDIISMVSSLNILGCMIQTQPPSLVRFVREHPELGCKLYLAVVVVLEDLSRNLCGLLESTPDREFIWEQVSCSASLALIVAHHIPATTTFPSLPPPSKNALLSIVSRCSEYPELAASWASRVALLVAGRHEPDFVRRGLLAEPGDAPSGWTSCELRVRSSTPSSCVELEDGVEMMACSRCFSVRYCSKDHQKQDWKRHKSSCFKPSW